MNGLRLVLYNNMCLLCVCLCVCVSLSMCLSHLRYPEREVVSPHCLHHLEELRLASCTNCFWAYTTSGSREKACERFSPVTPLTPCMHCYTSGYPGQKESCPLHQSCWKIFQGYALKDAPSISRVPRLPMAGWILPATQTALERFRRLHVKDTFSTLRVP